MARIRMTGFLFHLALASLLVLACPVSGSVQAAMPETSPDTEVLTLEEAARLLRVSPQEIAQLAIEQQIPARRIGRQWRFNRTALMAWLAGKEPVDAVLDQDAVKEVEEQMSELEMPGVTGRGMSGSSTDNSNPPATPTDEPETIGQRPQQATAEEVFLRDRGVLLKARELTLELGFFFSRSEGFDLTFIPADGGFLPIPALANVEQDVFTTTFTARYGLLDDLQLFASAPLQYRESTTTAAGQESEDSQTDLREFSLGLRHTVLKEGLGRPDVILSLEGQTPADEGFFGIGGGVALVKSFDPAVLFGNFNFRHIFVEDDADFTELQPENTFSASLGYAFALNDTLTLSTSVSGIFTSSTEFDVGELPSRERFSLQFGLTSWLARGLYVEPNVSFGLNGPGSDFSLGASLIYTPGAR